MITLLVPTMNKSDFIIRLLRYYKEVGFEGCICIGDGSSPDHVERTKRVIETLRDNLTIIYKEYPSLTGAECLKDMLDYVSTPYAVFSGDDDFLIPSALIKCAKFLEEHPDYAAAHGKGVHIGLDTNGLYGCIVECSNFYHQPEQEAESASQRLDDFLHFGGVPLFSVHRTETWRAMFRYVPVIKDNEFGSEMLPCCLSVILGKTKQLDCLYLVLQNHARRTYQPDSYDRITDPEWYSRYLVFRDSLVEALVLQDRISIEEAQKVFKQAHWAYLRNGLCSCSSGSHRPWVHVGRKIPGAQRIWQFLHSFSGVSLSALLRSSSPYHTDFMPVYKALTTPPMEFLDKTSGK